MSDPLIQFLRARYTEDTARQQNVFEKWHHRDCEAVPDVLNPDVETGACTCGVPERVLTETEAKRRLLTAFEEVNARAKYPDFDGGMASGLELALQHFALPYAAHADYREEWKP